MSKGKHYYSIQPNIPFKPWYNRIKLSKKMTSSIIRMRLGHVTTRSHLARFNIVDDPSCPCGYEEEDLNHIFFACPLYDHASFYNIHTQYEDLEGKLVLDAGCGPGVLALGSSLLGAGLVTAVDIDAAALQVFRSNADELEVQNVEVLQYDFLGAQTANWKNYFDTVIMNPPFGTKNNSGIDMKFLKRGLELSCNSVYSLHKTTTRSHVQKKIKEWGVGMCNNWLFSITVLFLL